MAKPYSMDLRERAMTRLEAGETSYAVAAALQVAVSSVIKWAAANAGWAARHPAKWAATAPIF
jgi:transposase